MPILHVSRLVRVWRFLQVWAQDGSVLFLSASLGHADLERIDGTIESPGVRWVTLPDGKRGRAVGMSFSPRREQNDEEEKDAAQGHAATLQEWPTQTVSLVLARHTAPLDALLGRLRTLLALVGLLAVAVSSGVLWFAVRQSLRPVDHLAEEIGRLGEQDLSSRVEVTPPVRELEPVRDRLNNLLDRLEAAFRRERSFSADVAHELRTPLAGLRTTAEVALSRNRTEQECSDAMRDVLQVTTQMEGIVEKLLSLSRLEARQVEIVPERVFQNDLLRRCWEPFAGSAEARRLRVQWALGPPARVTTDRRLLELAISNVIDNAVTYADEGGTLRFETAAGQDCVEIRISNTGSVLSRDEAEHVFERFWRGDAARSADGGHSGLGLSLVEKILEVLGGTARVESFVGGEFRVTLSIPTRFEARLGWQEDNL